MIEGWTHVPQRPNDARERRLGLAPQCRYGQEPGNDEPDVGHHEQQDFVDDAFGDDVVTELHRNNRMGLSSNGEYPMGYGCEHA